MVIVHYTLFQIKDRTLYDDDVCKNIKKKKETLSSPTHIILYTAYIVSCSMPQLNKIF